MTVNVEPARQWTALWNGDLAIAERILSPDFRIHFGAALPQTDAIHDPAGMAGFIGRWRATHEGILFSVRGAPVVEPGRLAMLWDVTHPSGAVKSGIDVLALRDDLIAEVWSVTGDRSFGA
jgi:hypothetical protein